MSFHYNQKEKTKMPAGKQSKPIQKSNRRRRGKKHSFAIAAKKPILFVGIADVDFPSVRNA